MTDVTLPSGIAKDELDADVRPQDDLFRHVNGKWIERTEIPARQGALRLVLRARRGGREGRARDHRGGAAAPSRAPRSARSATSTRASWTSSAPTCSARRRSRASSSTSALVDSIDAFLATLGRLERRASRASCSCSSTTTRATPSATSSSSSRAASACPTSRYFREEKFAERPHRVPRAPRAHVRAGAARRRRPTAPRASSTSRPTIAAHHWDNVDTRDSEETYNPMHLGGCRGARRQPVDLQRLARRHGRARGRVRRGRAARAELRRGTRRRCSTEERLAGVAGLARLAGHPLERRRTCRNDFVEANFDFYGRTLTGTPQMRDALEARRLARRGRAWARPSAASTSSGTSRPPRRTAMDDLVANLVEAYRAVDRRRSTGWATETRERALDKLEQVHAEDRLPGEVARLLEARDRPRTTWSANVRATDRVRVPARARQDRQADRPRRVVHDPADDQRVLQPGLQRDRVPRGDPAVPVLRRRRGMPRPTTARSARSSATRSGTASTTRARKYDGDGRLTDWWTEADRAAFEDAHRRR